MRPLTFVSLVLVLGCSSSQKSDDTTTAASSSTTSDGTDSTTATASDSASASATATSTSSTSTTSATTTDGSANTTDPTATTGGFVEMPDGGAGNECDPKAQDCMRGEKCTAWASDGGGSWNANKCVPVSGNGVDGDPCMVEGGGVSGLDDCDKGYMCWDVNEENLGTCVAFCDPDENCPEGTDCAVQNDGVLPICIPGCDPLLQDCPMGQGCYAIDGEGGDLICIPDASGAGGADGDVCEYDNVCDPGLICIGGSAGCMATWCCTPWCDVGAPNNCPGAASGEECVPHFTDPPPGKEDVGVCVIPQ